MDKQLLFRSTSMSMFHHQNQKNNSFNAQSQSPQPKSTTRSSSLRLHHLHNTKPQSSQSNLKTKRRPSSTFWSRNQKPHKILSSQLPLQLNQANQKFTSSNTRHKRKLAVPSVETMLEILASLAQTSQVAAISVFQLAVFHHLNTDHHNKRTTIQTACLVFSYCFKHINTQKTHSFLNDIIQPFLSLTPLEWINTCTNQVFERNNSKASKVPDIKKTFIDFHLHSLSSYLPRVCINTFVNIFWKFSLTIISPQLINKGVI